MKLATDDVQESQRRLKRRFRIVLENFLGIPYAGERADAYRGARLNINHVRGINIYHTRG